MYDDRRVLVRVSLRQEEQVVLRRLAKAAGVEPAVLAHEVLMEGLRHLQEVYGGSHALPTRERVGARAYPLRRVADLRTTVVSDLGEAKIDRVIEVLACGHLGHTYLTMHPAQLWDQSRRCAQCASPEQRARAKDEAVRR